MTTTTNEKVAARTLHHVPADNTNGKTTCGAAAATPDNSTTDPRKTTCKRCLRLLDAETTKALANTPDDPTRNKAEAPKDTGKAKTGVTADKAKDAITKLAAPKKDATPKNVHLHHDQTGTTLKSGVAAPNTWCKIPGPTTTDPSAVTCKVCRAHLDGTKPSNAISDDVRHARKLFQSFLARISYMLYMDNPASGGACPVSWCLDYTNGAGVHYTAGWGPLAGYVLSETQPGQPTEHHNVNADELKATIKSLCWEA